MTEENQKPSFWHNLGKKYPAPTICVLLACISCLLLIIGIGGGKIGENVIAKLAAIDGMHDTITRIDTTVADVKARQDRTDAAVSRLVQVVMEQRDARHR